MAVSGRVQYFVEVTLKNIPDKYSPDITLRVFQYIEANPDYLRRYQMLGGEAINAQIAQAIKDVLGMENESGNPIPVSRQECGLIGSYTRFKRRL